MRERHALIRYYYTIINYLYAAPHFRPHVNPGRPESVYTGRMEFMAASVDDRYRQQCSGRG